MSPSSAGAVAKTTADVANFANALENLNSLEDALKPLLSPSADSEGVLPKRLLFGSGVSAAGCYVS